MRSPNDCQQIGIGQNEQKTERHERGHRQDNAQSRHPAPSTARPPQQACVLGQSEQSAQHHVGRENENLQHVGNDT